MALVIWKLAIRFWPVLVAGLLFLGAWQFVEKQKKLAAEKAVLFEQRVQLEEKVEVLEADLKEEVAVSEVVAHQAETARIALKDRDKQLTNLRADHDHYRKQIRTIAANASPQDCLNQPVHPDVIRLLIYPQDTASVQARASHP